MSERCLLTKSVPLSDFTRSFLTDNDLQEHDANTDATFGGILSDSKYAWYANGPRFQVVDTKRGKTIAEWCFGSVVKDTSTKVVCVAEVPTSYRDYPVLVVGLEYVLTGGTIYVFDVLSSKVLRAIQLREKISSLHVIDGGKNLLPLYGPLRSFDGVIGVGCIGGDVLLVDLCLHSIEEEKNRDEVDACQVVTLTCKDLPNLEYHKQRLQAGTHLAINLNGSSNHKVNRRHNPNITISSLCYCPQLGSLLVGYSFGAWQIWELFRMTLVYTSPTYDKNVPISHFAIQEPADDPKPVCYIWAVYSHKEAYASYPLAVLYSLSYGLKEYHDGYGILYQEFHSCVVRYQMELASTSQNLNVTSRQANCLRLTVYTRSDGNKNGPIESQENVLSICCLVWTVEGIDGLETYLSLFDLNQWYKEQMPSSNSDDSDNYLLLVCVSDLIGTENDQLDVAIDERSLSQFLGVQKPEEHYYTTALSFDFCCCDEKMINFLHHQSQQRALLTNLRKIESVILLKPADVCQTALQLGLAPLFLDSSFSSIISQREFLLSLGLEQQMMNWLYKCANTWSNGRFKSTGCTLEFFFEWAWNRALILKTNVDVLSVPLFDYSESVMDANNRRIMNFCIHQLSSLSQMYEYILKNLSQFILHKDLVHQQCSSLQMVARHLQTLQWLVNSGLLPESTQSYLYPIDSLLPYYNKRRSELRDAFKKQFSQNESLLFIDNLIKHEFGNTPLEEYWKEDDGTELYPPPSMQSLLRTYLIDDVNLSAKHCVVIYAFLDMAMALDRDKHTFIITQLIKYPTIFQVNQSIIRLTQAFWHLDHGDFGPALDGLLDSLITNDDLKMWHHRIILNSFSVQGQYNLALTYYNIRKPPLRDDEDVMRILSLFVKNKMLHEAIDFQREHVTHDSETKILTYLYGELNSTKQLKKFLQYNLTQKEERTLMKYLRDVAHPHQEELEIMYYLHRHRYVDIFRMSDYPKSMVPSGLLGQKAMSFKDNFVKTLSGLFPKVALEVIHASQGQKTVLDQRVISRPQPISVVVNNTEEQPMYRSTFIQNAMMKARETWQQPVGEDSCSSEHLPFIGTLTPSITNTRKRPSIIYPKMIKLNEDGEEEDGESPTKKQKLSPRKSIGTSSAEKSLNASINMSSGKSSKLDTPVIKRKTRLFGQTSQSDMAVTTCTPQSILKVRNLITSHSLSQDVPATSLKPDNASSTSALGLTPRRSLSRLSVHFDKRINSPSTTESSEQISRVSNLSSILAPDESSSGKAQESNDIKETSDDVFYSPESSLEENGKKGSCNATEEVVKEVSIEEERKSLSPIRDTLQIKGRSSYRDHTPEKVVVQSTPVSEEKPTTSEESPPAIRTPFKAVGKVKSRKSLSRLVLENNALSTLSPTVRKSARFSLRSESPKRLSSILGEGVTADLTKDDKSDLRKSKGDAGNVENKYEASPSSLRRKSKRLSSLNDSKPVRRFFHPDDTDLTDISSISEGSVINLLDSSVFNTTDSSGATYDEESIAKSDEVETKETEAVVISQEIKSEFVRSPSNELSSNKSEQLTIEDECLPAEGVITMQNECNVSIKIHESTAASSHVWSSFEESSYKPMITMPDSVFESTIDEGFINKKSNEKDVKQESYLSTEENPMNDTTGSSRDIYEECIDVNNVTQSRESERINVEEITNEFELNVQMELSSQTLPHEHVQRPHEDEPLQKDECPHEHEPPHENEPPHEDVQLSQEDIQLSQEDEPPQEDKPAHGEVQPSQDDEPPQADKPLQGDEPPQDEPPQGADPPLEEIQHPIEHRETRKESIVTTCSEQSNVMDKSFLVSSDSVILISDSSEESGSNSSSSSFEGEGETSYTEWNKAKMEFDELESQELDESSEGSSSGDSMESPSYSSLEEGHSSSNDEELRLNISEEGEEKEMDVKEGNGKDIKENDDDIQVKESDDGVRIEAKTGAKLSTIMEETELLSGEVNMLECAVERPEQEEQVTVREDEECLSKVGNVELQVAGVTEEDSLRHKGIVTGKDVELVTDEDVELITEDVELITDVELIAEDVELVTEDVELIKEDLKLEAGDVKLATEDVELLTEDAKLVKEDIELNTGDVELVAEDVHLVTEDVELITEDVEELFTEDVELVAEDVELAIKSAEFTTTHTQLIQPEFSVETSEFTLEGADFIVDDLKADDVEVEVSTTIQDTSVEDEKLMLEENRGEPDEKDDRETAMEPFLTILVTNESEKFLTELPTEDSHKNLSKETSKDVETMETPAVSSQPVSAEKTTTQQKNILTGEPEDQISNKKTVLKLLEKGSNVETTDNLKEIQTVEEDVTKQREQTLQEDETEMKIDSVDINVDESKLKMDQTSKTEIASTPTEMVSVEKEIAPEETKIVHTEMKTPKRTKESADVHEQSSKKKVLIPILFDILKSPSRRLTRGLSVDAATPTPETQREKVGRTMRSTSADPETPQRKSRRLSGAGPSEETPSDASASKTPQRRSKRSVSTSDCDDSEKQTKGPARRATRTNSAVALSAIIEENADKESKNVRGKRNTKQFEDEETVDVIEKSTPKPKTSEADPIVDYPASRRVTRTQKNILAKINQSGMSVDLQIETIPPRTESSRKMTRTRSVDSTSSVLSDSQQDVGRTTRSGLRRKTNEDSSPSSVMDQSRASSVEHSPSSSRKRTRSASQRSDVVSEAESEASVPSVRRSTRSRSKTPDVLEKPTRTLRRGNLLQILEEPENTPAEEPNKKKGRTKKGGKT